MADFGAAGERLRYMRAGPPRSWVRPFSAAGESLGTRREPVGVVGLIAPWNFPLVMAAMKLAAALAVGCTAVLKPAEQTPLTALRLGDWSWRRGRPAGVVNIVTGFGETRGPGRRRIPDVDKIAFTGSPRSGGRCGAARPATSSVTLELGGKSPVIILHRRRLEVAITDAAPAAFS